MTIAKMNARDLIIDLLLGLQGREISIKQIIIAAKLFEISENSIRVAVTRLSSEGVIEAIERGVYQFTVQSHEWANVMLNRKNGIKQTKKWTHQYLAVFTGELGRVDRTALNRRERALKHFGFKELEQGIYIRPDNLAITFDHLFSELKASGLEMTAKICQISHFDETTLATIPTLWSTQTLNQNYEKYSQMIQKWLATVERISLEDAARESLLLGRQTISLLMNDPLSLVTGFPTSKKSVMRKFMRDLSGVTGFKFAIGRVLMDIEKMEWTVSNDRRWIDQTGRHWSDYPKAFLKNSGGAIATNTALFSALWAAGHPKLYALWVLAYVTPFPLLLRVRSMAEHAGMETSNSALTNTRTTKAGYIARALVAPIHVNYHKEHHLMAAVPYFKLPRMHQMLRERGHVAEPPTYWQVLNELSAKAD